MSIINRKTINIFLSGGGVKGSFSGGFLYKLGQWLELNKNYQIGKIYGTSIGAINGSIFLNNYNNLKLFWDSITSYKSMMSYWIKIPIIGKIMSIIYGFFIKCSLINPVNFYNLITKYCSHNDNNKLNICTTNITQSKTEYVDCSNNDVSNDITKYIIASSSLWLLSPPIKINNNYYADGGILKYLPFDYNIINQLNKNDINVVISCAKNINRNNSSYKETNLLFYLDNLLHMVCDILYEKDIELVNKLTNFKCYYVDQKLLNNISITTFTNTDIQLLWANGVINADNFIKTIL